MKVILIQNTITPSSTGSKYAARIMSDFRRENKLYKENLLMKGEINHEALA